MPIVPCQRIALVVLLLFVIGSRAEAAEPTAPDVSRPAARYLVNAYTIKGDPPLATNVLIAWYSKYTGTNISRQTLVQAAVDLQTEYRNCGYPKMSVAFSWDQITNGMVTMTVFQTAVPQIVVSGRRVFTPTNSLETISNSVAAVPPPSPPPSAPAGITNPSPAAASLPETPATPAEMESARAGLVQKMSELTAEEKDTRIHVVSTNAGPRFAVKKYLIAGNTILPPEKIAAVLTNIDGAYGTNVSFDGVRAVVEELQRAYHDRGYVTVVVSLPPQKLTNETVKVQVTEGRLVAINVVGNRYFSSNNVMRALPSLHTNMILNGQVSQAELNRANANQDRQIYPVVGPGPDPGTSELTLKVKDQLPWHGKIEFNNQNTPGTPDLRANSSIMADNLWQLGHSLGIQYGFSPEAYKQDDRWEFYDKPLVANYSGFYRLPLGNPEPVADVIANNPNTFGYDEATRRFNLPPPTGQTELNLYASRAVIDTGVETLKDTNFLNVPLVRQINQQEVQQGITINEDVGFQLTQPLPQVDTLQSTLSGGLDYKYYSQQNAQTNIFTFHEWTKNGAGTTVERTFHTYERTPITDERLNYLPLGLTYSAGLNNFMGPATLGLSLSANLWYDSSTLLNPSSTNAPNLFGLKSLQKITGSTESSGNWVILRPSFSQNIVLYPNWVFTVRADGQWASEPLISNEQFGIGGVNSVRGYHEGEIFGDAGWHVSLEQQTPPHVVGFVREGMPLTIRGSIYMDCATAYLLDPQGRPYSTELWGTGLGLTTSVGSHWQARFLFSLPLISTLITPRDQPYFNFSLTAQF